MAISFVADTFVTLTQTSNRTIAKPTGTTTDDVLVAMMFFGVDDAVTPPSGWTHEVNFDNNEPSQEHRFHAFWKRAGGSEPADYTWSWTGSQYNEIWIGAFRGVITSGNPVDASNAIHGGTSGTSANAISITTTEANTALIYMITSWNGGGYGPPTVPGTFTEPANGDGNITGTSYYFWSSSGDTGSVVGTATPAGTRSVILLALKPAAAAPSVFPENFFQLPQPTHETFEVVAY